MPEANTARAKAVHATDQPKKRFPPVTVLLIHAALRQLTAAERAFTQTVEQKDPQAGGTHNALVVLAVGSAEIAAQQACGAHEDLRDQSSPLEAGRDLRTNSCRIASEDQGPPTRRHTDHLRL